MRSLFYCCPALLLALLAPLARANTLTLSSSPGLAIPDGDLNGVADTISVSTPITSITSLTLTLNIQGGFDGDYYSYLTDGSGFAVLLNRIGRTSSNPFGSANSGLSVTFSDTAPNGDIHLAGAGTGTLTGTWQPDGRNVNPTAAVDTDSRTATLGSFTGLNPNGLWTLYVVDASSVGVGTFEDWSLTINGSGPGTSIPDGGRSSVLLALAMIPLIGMSTLVRRDGHPRYGVTRTR